MLEEKPAWRYKPRHSLTLGYGHFHLLPQHVLGQWFCVERETGKPLWDQASPEWDSILGVSEGVIVATSVGIRHPFSGTFGAFGIALQTGELLWTSHYAQPSGKGLWGWISRLIPVEFQDHAVGVRGSECFTRLRRVLDIHTGKEIRREPKTKDWPEMWEDESPGWTLYRRNPVDCRGGRILRHGTPEKPAKDGGFPDGTFALFLSDTLGHPLWSFDLAPTGYFIDGNYFS